MSTSIATKARPFMPVGLFVALSMLIASGVSILPTAQAVDTENVVVAGTVTEVITLNQATCPAAGGGFGTMALATPEVTPTWGSAACVLTLTVNRPGGAYINVVEDNVSGGANRPANTHPAFCRVSVSLAACVDAASGDTDSSVVNITADTAINAQDEFGALLTAKSASMTALWTEESGANASDANRLADTKWRPVTETGTTNKACEATVPVTTATCEFNFGVQIGTNQAAGTYEAKVAFEAVGD